MLDFCSGERSNIFWPGANNYSNETVGKHALTTTTDVTTAPHCDKTGELESTRFLKDVGSTRDTLNKLCLVRTAPGLF